MAIFDIFDLITLSSNTLPVDGETLTFAAGDFGFGIGDPISFNLANSATFQAGDTATIGTATYAITETVANIQLTFTVSDGSGGTVSVPTFASIITLEKVGSPGSFVTYLAPTDGIDLLGISQIEIDAINPNDTIVTLADVDGDDNVTIANFAVDGTVGDDTIVAGYIDADGDRIDGLDGINGSNDDLVLASAGNDIVRSGLGNDTIFGGDGNDTLFGGTGNDTIFGDDGNDTLSGDAGNDLLIEGVGIDTLWGGDGDDVFRIDNDFGGTIGAGNRNVYDAGDNAATEVAGDTLDAASMTDNATLDLSQNGGANSESGFLTTATGHSIFTGMENINLGSGDDTVIGSSGNDTVNSGRGNDTIDGGAGNDTFFSAAGDDTLAGGAGNDVLSAWTGNDRLIDDAGIDTLWGGDGDDTFIVNNDFGGTIGAGNRNVYDGGDNAATEVAGDTLNATGMTDDATLQLNQNGPGNPESGFLTTATGDSIFIGMENIRLGSGDDTVIGSSGNDTVNSGAGNDTLDGGAGNDTFFSAAGDDTLAGGAGNDVLSAGAGNDTLIDDVGVDTLLGGGGDDTFIVNNDFGGTVGNRNVYNAGDNAATEVAGDTLNATGMTDDATLQLNQNGPGNPESGFLTTATGDSIFIGMENIRLGSGNDTVIGSSGDDTVNSGAGNDTLDGGAGNDTFNLGVSPDSNNPEADLVIFSDGDGNDTLSNFEVPTDEGGGVFTGIDQLDVSNLTDATGNPVNTDDVTVTAAGSDTVLTFPGGESLTLVGVPIGAANSAEQLHAMGIPLPTVSMSDLIQTDGTVPMTGESLTVSGGQLTGVQDNIIFTVTNPTQIQIGDTAVIGGTTYTVNAVGNFSGTYRHDDINGDRVTTTDVASSYIVLDDGAAGTISFILPQDSQGDFPETGIIDVVGAVDTAPVPVSPINDNVTLICFASGTGIQTPTGVIKVEDLQVGQLVETLDNGLQPVRWIGRRKVAAIGKHAPIVFEKDTLGNKRKLLVSPQHRMLVSDWKVELLFAEDEVLVAAKHMVNGTSIKQVEGGEVEYFHILFDRHEIIFADGCAAESFYLGDESLKALGEATRRQFYKEFPTLIDAAKSNKTHTARICLKSFEAALLFDSISSLPRAHPSSDVALQNTRTIRPKRIAQKQAQQGFA